VHDLDAEFRDRPPGELEVARAEPPPGKLDDLEAELTEAIEEDPVARRADDELELVLRKVPRQIPDVPGPAAGARRHQELQDTDRPLRHRRPPLYTLR
jgi:hypothetical protein